MSRILIIEDDESIAEIEHDYLVNAGMDAEICTDGMLGLNEALKGGYDLILLDVMLPGISGYKICEKLREQVDVPILMVTALMEEADKIRGLSIGADDYIEKPFSPNELVARVKANLAQYNRIKGKEKGPALLQKGGITIDRVSHLVTVDGMPADLKNKEYELLVFFMENENMIFTRETLYERVWGFDAAGDSVTVAVHINRIREKIERNPSSPEYIQTIRGVGYRFHVPA